MERVNDWMVVGLMIAVLQLTGCHKTQATAHQDDEHPAEVKPIDGTELSRVTLSDSAIGRLDVRTEKVIEKQGPRKTDPQKSVPYSAVLYDANGKTWVYTSPEPRVFVRNPIAVDYTQGHRTYLTDGPPTGTEVATVGVAELYGTEFKVGH